MSPYHNTHIQLYRYWERTPSVKVSDFRRDLDRYSIFAGRNILELVSNWEYAICITIIIIVNSLLVIGIIVKYNPLNLECVVFTVLLIIVHQLSSPAQDCEYYTCLYMLD